MTMTQGLCHLGVQLSRVPPLGKMSWEASSSTSPARGSLPPAAIALGRAATNTAGNGSREEKNLSGSGAGPVEWAGPEEAEWAGRGGAGV